MDVIQHQRLVTRLLLDVVGGVGFALAGSGAIREHGLTARPTEDVDLFAVGLTPEAFAAAVADGSRHLRQAGYVVTPVRSAPVFARLEVRADDGTVLEVDFGVDWREHPVALLDIGPVLSRSDAVANKVGALYSRAETRDYLDVDAIRQAGAYTDEQLLELAEGHDAGFDRRRFADQLAQVSRLSPRRVAQYGVDAATLTDVVARLTEWSQRLAPPER